MSGTMRSGVRTAAGPVALVVAAVLGLWLAYGVTLGQALTYLGYEAVFILLPGWIAYRALARSPGGPLRQLVVGWALGYALEILAFMATAGTDHRGLLVAYPLLVVVVAGPVVLRRHRREGEAPVPPMEEGSGSPVWRWGLAGVTSAALVYVLIAYFAGAALPGHASEVSHWLDHEEHLSLAAEAKHHWPIEEPSVSGEPKPYHTFVYMHLAAASQVTGLDLPLIYFRLYIAPLLILALLSIAMAGRALSRDVRVGLIAVGLAIFVGQIDLDTTLNHGDSSFIPFWGLFTSDLYLSPSYVFGLAMFAPLLLLLMERLDPEAAIDARPAPWLVVGLLMVGASNAKIPILPLLIVALVIFGAWRFLRDRELDRAALIGASLATMVFLGLYLIQYRGTESPTELWPFDFLGTSAAVLPVLENVKGFLPDFPLRLQILEVLAAATTLLFMLAPPLIGLAWLRFRGRWPRRHIFLLATGLAGVMQAVLIVDTSGPNVLYGLFYGAVPLIVLSAQGLRLAWLKHRESIRPQIGRWLPVVLPAAIAIVVLSQLPDQLDLFEFTAPQGASHLMMFWYGGLLVILGLVYLLSRLRAGAVAAAAAVTALVLAVGAAAAPFNYFRNNYLTPHDASRLGKPLNDGHFAALEWIRDHTDSDAVLAVNNYSLDPTNLLAYFTAYSAYSERRTFIEGWRYAARSQLGIGKPPPGPDVYRDRTDLNGAAYAGSIPALDRLWSTYGVRYILVDKPNGTVPVSACLYLLGKLVVSNPSMDVLALSHPPSAREGREAGCA